MFSTTPTMRPPMIAPGIESSPPRITTGNTLKPTRARFTSTPSRLPHRIPPRADTTPVIAHATPKPPSPGGPRRHETRDHHELALGEVDGVGRLVDQHEPQRDQRVHQADQEAVRHQEEEEAQVVRHGPWSPPRRPRRARATS